MFIYGEQLNDISPAQYNAFLNTANCDSFKQFKHENVVVIIQLHLHQTYSQS